MIGSIIGLLASFILTIDTIKIIKDPGVVLPCNISPFVSCTSVATASQGSIFGFPNPLLGIVSFSMLLAIGTMLFSGGRSRKPLWLLVNLGALASMAFVMWFFYESVYKIGSLCIYCMTVWIVTWPIFLYTTLWNFKEDHFKFDFLKVRAQEKIDKIFNIIYRNHFQILSAWYIAIIFAILFQFKDFFFN